MSGAIPKRSQREQSRNTPLLLRRTSPPPTRTACTCPRGLCVNCRCTQSNYFCSERCNCNPDRCRNRPRIVTPVLWPLAQQDEAVEPQRPPVIPVEEVNIRTDDPENREEEVVEPLSSALRPITRIRGPTCSRISKILLQHILLHRNSTKQQDIRIQITNQNQWR